MKRKVNINREKISSEEIASEKKFSTLVKSYPTLASPLRRTTWRTKSIIWVVIACVGLVWYLSGRSEFERFEADKIVAGNNASLDIRTNAELRKEIKERIVNARKISGPAKGARVFEVEMTHGSDTIRITSYGGGKYFYYQDQYFEAPENLLPDSVVANLIR